MAGGAQRAGVRQLYQRWRRVPRPTRRRQLRCGVELRSRRRSVPTSLFTLYVFLWLGNDTSAPDAARRRTVACMAGSSGGCGSVKELVVRAAAFERWASSHALAVTYADVAGLVGRAEGLLHGLLDGHQAGAALAGTLHKRRDRICRDAHNAADAAE
jgi:hypothetical protein